MHASPFPSPAAEMANSSLLPCIISGVADLSSGWHADPPLVYACSPLVFRSIHPPYAPPSLLDECAPLAAERNPKRHQAKQACGTFVWFNCDEADEDASASLTCVWRSCSMLCGACLLC